MAADAPRAAGPARRPLAYDPIAEAARQWRAHGWGEAADGMAAVTSLVRAHQIVMSRVEEVLRPFGVTFARYELVTLLHFSKAGSLPLARIGTLLQVHPTSVTNAVDRCEAAGLVRRIPHPTDRRATLAEVTPAGRELVGKATEALNRDVFADLRVAAGDVTALVEVLGRFRSAHGDFQESGPEG
ncbi:MAG: MarR family winged helix-turn-helix transcriptional regulator [Kineosporiaceae bacterium]